MAKNKECPSCAMMVDKKEKECPICGYEFAEIPATYRLVALLLVLMFLLYLIF